MNQKMLCAALLFSMLIIAVTESAYGVKADSTSEPEVSWNVWVKDSNILHTSFGSERKIMTIQAPIVSGSSAVLKVNVSSNWPINSVYYEADWQEGTHRIYSLYNSTSTTMLYRLSLTVNFTEIPDGNHHLKINANLHDGTHISSSTDFTINTPPTIMFLSKNNETCQTADLPLNFTVNEPTKWIGYSLDGQENVTITGNNTIPNLPNGFHSLNLYANDTVGNVGASSEFTFMVKIPEPFPILSVIVVTVTILVIIIISLLLFRRNRKQKSLAAEKKVKG